MKVCVAKPDSDVLFLDVETDTTVEELKGLVFSVTSVPVQKQTIMFQGVRLREDQTLQACGVQDNDVLEVLFRVLAPQVEQLFQRNGLTADRIEQMAADSSLFRDALEANDSGRLDKLLRQMKSLRRQQAPPSPSLQRFGSSDVEEQKRIEEEIRRQNIDENLLYANEFTPEVFASVSMLYIDCTVNKVALQAFVDSGAQNTILSQTCAERLGLRRLIDTRYHGTAVGVGSGKIIGRIHAANLEIRGRFFNCSFTVLERMDIDMLFGLDMLKRHQCCIDLHKNRLLLSAGEVEVPFLSERSISRRPGGDSLPADDEGKMQSLLRLGYREADILQALAQAHGDVSLAEGILFNSVLG